jgi:uncharacterized membrane protein YphA (DoxX/SURF4 family)
MARWVLSVRWTAGVVFVVAGLAKFVANAAEVRAFDSFGCPGRTLSSP